MLVYQDWYIIFKHRCINGTRKSTYVVDINAHIAYGHLAMAEQNEYTGLMVIGVT